MRQRAGICHWRLHASGGSRKHFGALLVGYYEKDRLLFAGKVGTGFNSKLLASLHQKFRAEAREDCPFADLPSKQDGKWVQGITPSMMRTCHWVNPVFVCQVKFAEWTRDANCASRFSLACAR